jgi:hypothetical protein
LYHIYILSEGINDKMPPYREFLRAPSTLELLSRSEGSFWFVKYIIAWVMSLAIAIQFHTYGSEIQLLQDIIIFMICWSILHGGNFYRNPLSVTLIVAYVLGHLPLIHYLVITLLQLVFSKQARNTYLYDLLLEPLYPYDSFWIEAAFLFDVEVEKEWNWKLDVNMTSKERRDKDIYQLQWNRRASHAGNITFKSWRLEKQRSYWRKVELAYVWAALDSDHLKSSLIVSAEEAEAADMELRSLGREPNIKGESDPLRKKKEEEENKILNLRSALTNLFEEFPIDDKDKPHILFEDEQGRTEMEIEIRTVLALSHLTWESRRFEYWLREEDKRDATAQKDASTYAETRELIRKLTKSLEEHETKIARAMGENEEAEVRERFYKDITSLLTPLWRDEQREVDDNQEKARREAEDEAEEERNRQQ